MAHEIQPINDRQEEQSSLPAHMHLDHLGLRLAYFGYTAVPAGILLDIMTQGQHGESAAVAAFLGGTVGYWAPHLHKAIEPGLRAARHAWDYLNRNHSGRTKHRLLNKDWWMGYDITAYGGEEGPQAELEAEEAQAELPAGEPDIDQREIPPEPDPSNSQRSAIPEQFSLGKQALDAIREVNHQRYIYFGRTASREVLISLNDMYHVLDIASSGKGKSNRFRLAMMQLVDLAETYFINPLANGVKAVTDNRKVEVWQPIFDRLANRKPIKERAEILHLMTALVAEIQTRERQEAARDFSWSERPIFVFIDELPEVVARCPEAIELLDKIGRTGRQFHIFCWVASQTANVNDIGLSTAAQAQFKTRIYGGGDKTSADRVMKGSVTRENETILQTSRAGLSLMLADGFSSSEFVRAPLLSNEALFAYFDLPPFQKEEWLGPLSVNQQPGRRMGNLMEMDLSFSFARHIPSTFSARNETLRAPADENESDMKRLPEHDEKHESLPEKDETFIPSHEDEIAVLMAVLQLQNEGVNVTREAIKQRLGWNNAKHPVVKFVCDKHKIAVR